jgi:hypothetical protein
MRRTFISLLSAVALLMALAGAGQAGTFDAANSNLQVILSTLPGITIGGNPGGAASGAGPVVTAFATPTKPFGPTNVDLPDSLFTGVPQIVDLRLQGLDLPGGSTAVFTTAGGFGGGFGGIAPLSGSTTICAFSCPFGLQIQVPLGVIGGSGTQLFTTALGVPLTVSPGTGWTTGVAVITGLGSPTPSAFATGSNSLTSGNGAGSVTLVTPVRVNVGAIGQILPLFGIAHLEFVPEPAEMLMLAAGALVFAAYGRRRMRR